MTVDQIKRLAKTQIQSKVDEFIDGICDETYQNIDLSDWDFSLDFVEWLNYGSGK